MISHFQCWLAVKWKKEDVKMKNISKPGELVIGEQNVNVLVDTGLIYEAVYQKMLDHPRFGRVLEYFAGEKNETS